MTYLKQLNDIYTRYDLKGHESAFCREIETEDLRFFNALYFDADLETKKRVYCEYQTMLNIRDLCNQYKHYPSLQDILRGSVPENKWNQLEKEIGRYNPFVCLKGQKRQDKIDITTLPDYVELLFNYSFSGRWTCGDNDYFLLKTPIVQVCPHCSASAQVYAQKKDYRLGKHYVKALCRKCRKVFETDLTQYEINYKEADKEERTDFIKSLLEAKPLRLDERIPCKTDWVSISKQILQYLKTDLEQIKITDITQMDNTRFCSKLYDCLVKANVLPYAKYQKYFNPKASCFAEMNHNIRKAKQQYIEEYIRKFTK